MANRPVKRIVRKVRKGGKRPARKKTSPKTSFTLLKGLRLTNVTARFAPGDNQRRGGKSRRAVSVAGLIAAARALREEMRR